MKTIIILIVLFACTSFTFAQDSHDSEVLTLSKGKYREIFDNDTIEIIAGSLLDTKNKKVIGYIDEEELREIEEQEQHRFFAVDPLAPSYPHNSPYAFSENVVISAIELEGLEKYDITRRWSELPENTGYRLVVDMEFIKPSERKIGHGGESKDRKADIREKGIVTPYDGEFSTGSVEHKLENHKERVGPNWDSNEGGGEFTMEEAADANNGEPMFYPHNLTDNKESKKFQMLSYTMLIKHAKMTFPNSKLEGTTGEFNKAIKLASRNLLGANELNLNIIVFTDNSLSIEESIKATKKKASAIKQQIIDIAKESGATTEEINNLSKRINVIGKGQSKGSRDGGTNPNHNRAMLRYVKK